MSRIDGSRGMGKIHHHDPELGSEIRTERTCPQEGHCESKLQHPTISLKSPVIRTLHARSGGKHDANGRGRCEIFSIASSGTITQPRSPGFTLEGSKAPTVFSRSKAVLVS
jgi:hypothetical protein